MKCISFFAYCLSNENSNSKVELIRAAPSGICHFAEAVTKGEPWMNLADFKVQRMAQRLVDLCT